jgi:hypothetical protein
MSLNKIVNQYPCANCEKNNETITYADFIQCECQKLIDWRKQSGLKPKVPKQ